jgi:hypothetical protein
VPQAEFPGSGDFGAGHRRGVAPRKKSAMTADEVVEACSAPWAGQGQARLLRIAASKAGWFPLRPI